ncbi:uncharacterized protein DUF955 [Orenia metallireducens]|uniref:IrrE N-terminal-like domain-containing protein n=1 Tax=Orenia metallireducens TaxID=1413210 RepID=A0A285HSG9_9FIRM|nr:ImmA/IrrE family metallo-endopeptidase [Orenia metallireducens]PRX24042.1 uncharacterized protein DUF955 [Orenia metallireducens]SNY38637.1 protein of unknown function [Orenia metallireducens]
MSKIKHAEIVARQFLKKHKLKVPINIEEIAKLLNIRVTYASFEGDGAILYNGKAKLIIVNKNQEIGQLRFNIAHEISHFLLKHRGKIFNTHPGDEKPLYEKCADTCASELLIPRNELKRKHYQFNGDIQKLKNYFQVSEKAMITKMNILNLPYHNTFYK